MFNENGTFADDVPYVCISWITELLAVEIIPFLLAFQVLHAGSTEQKALNVFSRRTDASMINRSNLLLQYGQAHSWQPPSISINGFLCPSLSCFGYRRI